jgi:Cu(I)/Ag(I) efflux system periplasmic protein CusF
MKKIIFIILMAVFSLACQQSKQPESVQNQTSKTVPSVSPSASPVVSPTQTTSQPQVNTEVKLVDSKGIVTKIDLKLGSVELDHEEIKGVMPAMIMEFYVKDKKMLDGLKLGDKVDFTLEDNKGQEMIVKLAKN